MNDQRAYQIGHHLAGSGIDEDVAQAMYTYLRFDLGLSEMLSRQRADAEVTRDGAKKVIDHLARHGIVVSGRDVLDLGAGLGGLSEELIFAGARVLAIEPGAAWAPLAERRIHRHGRHHGVFRSRGEHLPVRDASVDVVISLQVLEHVQDPKKVLEEAWRVVRPGGYFYLACENYLAFREGHYRIFWLPLLPKPLGSLYLRARGRPPAFLREAVTYVTFPQIMGWTRRLGFVRVRDERIRRRLSASKVPTAVAVRPALLADRFRQTFRFGIGELFYKPEEAV